MCSARLLIFALAPFCVATCASLPEDGHRINGRIVAVADGDTITLLDAGMTQYKIRLDGIDASDAIYLLPAR